MNSHSDDPLPNRLYTDLYMMMVKYKSVHGMSYRDMPDVWAKAYKDMLRHRDTRT